MQEYNIENKDKFKSFPNDVLNIIQNKSIAIYKSIISQFKSIDNTKRVESRFVSYWVGKFDEKYATKIKNSISPKRPYSVNRSFCKPIKLRKNQWNSVGNLNLKKS